MEHKQKLMEAQERQRNQKMDAEGLAEERRANQKLREENQVVKQAVQQLEKTLENKIMLIKEIELQIRDLSGRAAKTEGLEKEKKRLKDDISHLQDEILAGSVEFY